MNYTEGEGARARDSCEIKFLRPEKSWHIRNGRRSGGGGGGDDHGGDGGGGGASRGRNINCVRGVSQNPSRIPSLVTGRLVTGRLDTSCRYYLHLPVASADGHLHRARVRERAALRRWLVCP